MVDREKVLTVLTRRFPGRTPTSCGRRERDRRTGRRVGGRHRAQDESGYNLWLRMCDIFYLAQEVERGDPTSDDVPAGGRNPADRENARRFSARIPGGTRACDSTRP